MSDVNMSVLSLSTWNVNVLGHPIKKRKVITFLKRKKYDIVFLQETHLSPQEAEKFGKIWGGHVFFSAGSSKSRGVIILVNKHLQFKCLKQFKDKLGRVIIVLAEIQGQSLMLANIYAPNVDDQGFFIDLEGMLQSAGTAHDIILGGDFNLLMDSVLDHCVTKVRTPPRATVTLHRMCKNLGLADIWRLLNPSGRDYTFFFISP